MVGVTGAHFTGPGSFLHTPDTRRRFHRRRHAPSATLAPAFTRFSKFALAALPFILTAPSFLPSPILAADYATPAGHRPAIFRPGAPGILPGGRIVAPAGHQYVTGPGPYGLAVSPDGKTVVSANTGPEKASLTVMERDKKGAWAIRHLAPRARSEGRDADDAEKQEWRSVFMGVAFSGNRSVYVSEGNSGRVRLVDLATGSPRKIYDLNQDGFADSYTGDLALDPERGLLYVTDQANFRIAIIDTKKARVSSSLRLGRLPFAIALSADGKRAYVTNIGMFEYQALPGADRRHPRETGLPFAPFGFPSAESRDGVERQTANGPIRVPGLGDPNVRESNSVCIVNVEDAAAPKVEAFIPAGKPYSQDTHAGSSPSGVLAAGDRVFISNSHNDSITVIDSKTNRVTGEILIRIPGLEAFRGVLPMGMAFHAASGWLLVAEGGINAIAVIDTKQLAVIGHIPVGWFPTRVAIDHDTIYVANARGQGTGPNPGHRARPPAGEGQDAAFIDTFRRGTVSGFPLPDRAALQKATRIVLEANGFIPRPNTPAPLPSAIRYVVLIVKENRTFDEVFGDITQAANGPVAGLPALARFGSAGYVNGEGKRLSLEGVAVTPNHHSMAQRWSISDNFYADSEISVDGHHWLVGAYPDVWTETSLMAQSTGEKDFRLPTKAPGRLLFAESNSSVHPEEQTEAGTIWHHFARHNVSFRNFGEGFELAGVDEGPGLKPTGARFLTNMPMPDPLYRNTSRDYPMFNMNIPDQFRAAQFIKEIEQRYQKDRQAFPRFLFIHLPNDHMANARPEDGYPYRESFVADNDYALGKMVEFLSHSPWWREMAIFITEDDAQGGRDHIDSHRTVLIGAGPYFKKGYASHVNSSFPGLLKTIFRLLGVPPLNLFDATAADLSDCFTGTPDFTPYQLLPIDSRLFEPDKAREPLDPKPSPRMDDPRVLRELQLTRPEPVTSNNKR